MNFECLSFILNLELWDHGARQRAVLRALSLPQRISNYIIYIYTTFIVTEISYCVRFEVLIAVINSSGMPCCVAWYVSTAMSALAYHATHSPIP
jgi:hypothetical protein